MTSTSGDTLTAAPHARASEVTVHDRLPVGHRYRLALEDAIRSSLCDLSGRWDVSMRAVGRILVQVDVVAPDGSPWSLAVPVPEGPEPEDVADTIRRGITRLGRVNPSPPYFGESA